MKQNALHPCAETTQLLSAELVAFAGVVMSLNPVGPLMSDPMASNPKSGPFTFAAFTDARRKKKTKNFVRVVISCFFSVLLLFLLWF